MARAAVAAGGRPLRGRAWLFGDNIDTDAIIPARYCNTVDPQELAQHCMEDANADFVHQMRRGDLIVGGDNFGCGSSREVAPVAIQAAGVRAVVAKSFARIFFRNAINIGLPIFTCADIAVAQGDELEIDAGTGVITDLTSNARFRADAHPAFLRSLIAAGGLHGYVQSRITARA
jgi:3-isopropylmalate/(R)-2-methylmalate dehydratase small subunit